MTGKVAQGQPPPAPHPEMARIYRTKVTEIATALQQPESRVEATDLLGSAWPERAQSPNRTLTQSTKSLVAGLTTAGTCSCGAVPHEVIHDCLPFEPAFRIFSCSGVGDLLSTIR
jgi:hypothetical protein